MTSSERADLLRRIALQEGGLVEVCVNDTSYEDWELGLAALEAAGYRMSLETPAGTVPVALIPEMFTNGEDISFTLRVDVGRQHWTTQFYSTSLLDFQGDPTDVTSGSDLEDIASFMKVLAEATAKTVRFVPESLDPKDVKSYFDIDPVTMEIRESGTPW